MWRKTLGAAALILLVVTTPGRAAPADAAGFISSLGDQTIRILQSTPSTEQRKAAFSRMFTEAFDVPALAKFVLGRYWRTATPEQQSKYVHLFGQYVVALYSNRFAAYSGQQFKVLGSQPQDQASSIVRTQIVQPNGGPPVNVDWQVAREGNGFKITNVMLDNLSMAITERDEFSSVIEQHGGSVQALIDMLQEKVQQG